MGGLSPLGGGVSVVKMFGKPTQLSTPGSNQEFIVLESDYNYRTLFCRLNSEFASMKKTPDRILVALIPILLQD